VYDTCAGLALLDVLTSIGSGAAASGLLAPALAQTSSGRKPWA
jgi:hypothetical protein